MKNEKQNQKLPNWAWLILLPVFLYGLALLIANNLPDIDLGRILLWMKFIAASSFVAMGGFYIYYLFSYGFTADIVKEKKWDANRIVALFITIFLIIILGIMFFTSVSLKDSGVIIFGIFLGSIYVLRGGSLPNWIIEFSQKFNFFTGGSITADDDPGNLSPKIYLPIIFLAILIGIIAYGIFIKGY
jgi:hypothetical protein